MGVHQFFFHTKSMFFICQSGFTKHRENMSFGSFAFERASFWIRSSVSLYHKLCVFQTNIVESWCSHNGLNVDVFCITLILGMGSFGESYCFCCCQRWKRVCFFAAVVFGTFGGLWGGVVSPSWGGESSLSVCNVNFSQCSTVTLRKGDSVFRICVAVEFFFKCSFGGKQYLRKAETGFVMKKWNQDLFGECKQWMQKILRAVDSLV